MPNRKYNILLADDDEDDRMFFKEALENLSLSASLNTVDNGVELMNFLENNTFNLPHVLFLDLNMPRKTGFECLSEIKLNQRLKQLPVIIYSTSSNPEEMELLYNNGALHYIRKPADFTKLKSVIRKAISLSREHKIAQPLKEDFVIQPE
ncbi:response regulator [soil metagenome]